MNKKKKKKKKFCLKIFKHNNKHPWRKYVSFTGKMFIIYAYFKCKKFKICFKKLVQLLLLKYSQCSLWIGQIKCGFKFDIKPYVKRKLVSGLEDCPTYCPSNT